MPLPNTVHPAINAIVKKALTAQVDNRFSTAAEMQQALEDAMVEAKLSTNTGAVAAFLTEHVGERAKKRKEAITVGLKAAAERERYAEIMRSNVRTTHNTTGGFPIPAALDEGAQIPGHGSRSGIGSNPGVGSRSGVGSNPGSRSKSGVGSNPGPGSRSGAGGPPISGGGNSVVTSGTLGSAAMDVGVAKPPRGRAVAFASVAAGAVLGIGGLVIMLTRQPSPEHGEEKAATQAPAAVTASASPPAVVTVTTPWTATAPPPATPSADAESATAISPEALKPVPPVTATATGQAPVPAPNPVGVMPPAPHPVYRPPVAPSRPGTKKTRIDDGF